MPRFTAYARHFDKNTQDSAGITAHPVNREHPDGGTVPGIGIFTGRSIRFVLDPDQAIALANSIADAADRIHQEAK